MKALRVVFISFALLCLFVTSKQLSSKQLSSRPSVSAPGHPSVTLAQLDESRVSVQTDSNRQDTRQRPDIQLQGTKDYERARTADQRGTVEKAASGDQRLQDASRIDRRQARREPLTTR